MAKLDETRERFLKPPEKLHVYDPSVRDLRNPFDWFCPFCEKVAAEPRPITLGEVVYCRACGGKLYVDNEGFTKARADDLRPATCVCPICSKPVPAPRDERQSILWLDCCQKYARWEDGKWVRGKVDVKKPW